MPRRAKRDCEDNPLEKGLHAPDLRALALQSIEIFFRNKLSPTGDDLDLEELQSEDNIKAVLRTQNDDRTFLFIHNDCLEKMEKPSNFPKTPLPWTVQYLLYLIGDMKKKHLPKDFQPGLLLLYFKYCCGLQIPPPPLL